MGDLNMSSMKLSLGTRVMSDLIMRSKGFAIFGKLLSLVGSPFELANLYHFGTDLSNSLDGSRPQIFDMLNKLWKRDESVIFGRNPTLYHAKFVNANHRTVFKALGANTKQKQCLCVVSNNQHVQRLACLLR